MLKYDEHNIYLHFFDRELRNSLGRMLRFNDSDAQLLLSRSKRLFVSKKTIAACFQQKAQYIVISPLRYTTFSIRVCTRS